MDAFPSAICLLHLKDNPLEIPPQMFTAEHKAEEEDIVRVLNVQSNCRCILVEEIKTEYNT